MLLGMRLMRLMRLEIRCFSAHGLVSLTNTATMNNIYLLAILAIAAFFALYKSADAPLLDAVESRNGVNAVEMSRSGNYTQLTYADAPDAWHTKPPLSVWSIAASFRALGHHAFALRLPMALATVLLFFFLFKLIRLYQEADFAFYSCLILLSVKGLVGRHLADLGEFDAIFTCFAVAGTYFFLRYFDFRKRAPALYLSAICFGLSFLSKGFGVMVFLFGIMMYVVMRRQLLKTITRRAFLLALVIFLIFPLFWLALQNGDWQAAFIPNIHQEYLSYTTQFGGRNWWGFFNYLNAQFEWWNYLFYLSMPVGFYLVYLNQHALEQNFTTIIADYNPPAQLPRSRLFTIGELLAREDLKPNIQLLLLSICIWWSLAVVCTISQNVQYLAFALPFIAITTAACIFYFNHRYEWFRYIFIAMLAFTFWGQLDRYVRDYKHPDFILKNEDVLQNATSLAIDDNLPSQDILLYLYFLQNDIRITAAEDRESELVFCHLEQQFEYPDRPVIYQDDTYVLLGAGLGRMEDRLEM